MWYEPSDTAGLKQMHTDGHQPLCWSVPFRPTGKLFSIACQQCKPPLAHVRQTRVMFTPILQARACVTDVADLEIGGLVGAHPALSERGRRFQVLPPVRYHGAAPAKWSCMHSKVRPGRASCWGIAMRIYGLGRGALHATAVWARGSAAAAPPRQR
jgi:hypothetical protein